MKTFVIHASNLIEREEYIDRALKRIGLAYEFILEGDVNDLTDAILDKYLADGPDHLRQKSPQASCSIKHFLAYERIVAESIEGALILEDDIILHEDFMPVFIKSIDEYNKYYADKSVVISYEDSSLQFVPRSQREKGRLLYPGKKDRMAGAYFINYHGAKAILDELYKKPTSVPVDYYQYQLLQHGIIQYLWCQPAIATQGSFTGEFRSSLSGKKDRMIKIRWKLKKAYKHLLYFLR